MNREDIGHLEVVRYGFEFIDGEPKIVIHQVKALDKDGKYIKFVRLAKLSEYLCDFKIVFKDLK